MTYNVWCGRLAWHFLQDALCSDVTRIREAPILAQAIQDFIENEIGRIEASVEELET